MKTVLYLVTAGSYSDYHVVGVFSSREKAEQITTFLKHTDIEEIVLDPFISEINKGLVTFHINMETNGNTITVIRDDHPDGWHSDYPLLDTLNPIELHRSMDGKSYYSKRVFARDEKHAVKIVNELRVQHIANQSHT